MEEFLSTYKYLVVVVLGLPSVMLAYLVFPDQRRMMFISGAVLSAFSPLIGIFQEEYWSPQRLGGLVVGIEDYLLDFSIGSLLWLAMVWPFRERISFRLVPARFALRFFAFLSLGVGFVLVLRWTAGIGIMHACVYGQILLSLLIVRLQKELWVLPVAAAALFTPYMLALHYSAAWMIPEYFSMWDGPTLLGPRLFGLPVEEILWALTFSSYTLLVAYSADIRMAPSVAGSR